MTEKLKIPPFLFRIFSNSLTYLTSRSRFTSDRLPLKRTPKLMFGDWPGVKVSIIPEDDHLHKNTLNIVDRCRAFPNDLEVFRTAEPETKFLPFLTSPNKVSIDVGANIGFYSALLSPLSRRVISFEANPKLLLYISLITHRFDNISIFPVAVGSGSGEIKFNIPFGSDGDILSHSGSGASSPLFLSKMGIEFREAMVPIVAIDNFKFDNIGFLKIDVEGAEYDVLMGAFETINKNRPNIVLENEFRHNKNCSNIFDFMERCKYNGYFYDRLAKKIKSLSLFSLQENQIDLLDMNGDISDPNRYVYNFIFIPSEHDQLLNLVDQEEAL